MDKKTLSSPAKSSKGEAQASSKAEVKIANSLGLHARAAASFVKLANRFRSTISVQRDNVAVNGKSIMGVLMLAADLGSTITICAQGPDAEQAISALVRLVQDKFGEE